MSGWRAISFDRELARGTIRSGIGELPFDAAVADVDDFRADEEVDVTLVRSGESYTVTRVRPVAWRDPPAPPSRPELSSFLDAARSAVRDRTLSLSGVDGELLRIAIQPESYEPDRTIEFVGCVLVQMPMVIDDLANVSAFAFDAFASACGDIARHWPSLDPKYTVFRLEPRFFGQAAAYIVAWDARLVGG